MSDEGQKVWVVTSGDDEIIGVYTERAKAAEVCDQYARTQRDQPSDMRWTENTGENAWLVYGPGGHRDIVGYELFYLDRDPEWLTERE